MTLAIDSRDTCRDFGDYQAAVSPWDSFFLGAPFDSNNTSAPGFQDWSSLLDSSGNLRKPSTQNADSILDPPEDLSFSFDAGNDFTESLKFGTLLTTRDTPHVDPQDEKLHPPDASGLPDSVHATRKRRREERDQPVPNDDSNGDDESTSSKSIKRRRKPSRTTASPPATSPAESSGSFKTANSPHHRERNRVAAHKCRQKAKKSVSVLQERERQLHQQNQMLVENLGCLRDEILSPKNEILRHSDCDSELIQNYIAKAARNLR
ncbi:Uu.00g044270.m01.CDS01 [Anthostomella pinea]|uniref:Uu.00g044270.m01.CDS01 n=1 Tax=Anthostomella pinea TaxID=933095 RepID=A0AAI8VAW9_9PEZI|nr:Uu.00g044270.m01.CDS01 [Anthostomella pinea]